MEELECAPVKEDKALKKAQAQLKGLAWKLSFLSFLLPPFLCVLSIYIHRYMSSNPEPLAMLGYNFEKVSASSW